MKHFFKKYFAFLLFVIFLFPQLEKELHTWQHINDFHCKSTTTHFHLQEHNCSICDFISPSLTDAILYRFSLGSSTYKDLNSFFQNTELFQASLLFIPLRAPPTIS